MNYPGSFCLLVGSAAVLFVALALPYMTANLREPERTRIPVWAFVAALVLLGFAWLRLRAVNPTQFQLINALALTTVMLAGICVKWLMETVAQKKVALHESVLCGTLLVAPLAIVFSGRLFPSNPAPGGLLVWFLNGYFWHALLSDIERLMTRERIIIRRREPPILPHDFRKPEIS